MTVRQFILMMKPITENALFSNLARHVLELSGHSPTDPAEQIFAYSVGIARWKVMHIEKHIDVVGKAL